jgi:hypothetical protein
MRRVLGIVVILLYCIWLADLRAQPDPLHTSAICIEYFGEQASPLSPVVIGDSKAAAESGNEEAINDTLLAPSVHVVDPKVMDQLISEVGKIPTHEIELKKPYVVFHVVVLKDGHREVKILDGDQTFGLLDQFKSIYGQGSLFDQLVYVQRVIEFYEGKGHTA